MKSTAKTLALGAALLCLLAGGMALPASAAVPLTGAAVSLPWNSDNSVPAESIEAGTYSSNMLLGETQQLSPTVRPRNSTDSVIYLTDDSSVLTVSNSGVVQAVGVGTATVTAAAGDQICAYTISVSMDSTMIVTEMDLALSSNTIYVGNSVSASLQVRPSSASQYATISLTSSNEKVATVNNFGKVTGVAPGKATITATDGNVSCTATVTVVAANTSTVSSQSISLNTNYVVLKPGSSKTITGKVSPASASQSLTFKSQDKSIATVSGSGVITGVATGATSVVVSNGTASTSVTVIVNRTASTSGSSSDTSGEGTEDNVTTDATVAAIQNAAGEEVSLYQSDVPAITGEILSALRTTGRSLIVLGEDYTLRIDGTSIKSTQGGFSTALTFAPDENGLSFQLGESGALPCVVQITLTGENAAYSRLYLHNTASEKWQFLNSYKDGTITADTAGSYLLTNQNLRFTNINWTFFIAAGALTVVCLIVYIAVKKRYWFW